MSCYSKREREREREGEMWLAILAAVFASGASSVGKGKARMILLERMENM